MTKIHGVIWVGLGLLILGFSEFFSRLAPTANFGVFFIAGAVFLIWGGIRLSSQYWLRRDVKPTPTGPPPRRQHPQPGQGSPHQTHQHVRHPHGSHQQTHQHVKPHPHPSHHAQQASYKRCPHCHHPIQAQATGCPLCHGRV